MQFSTICQFLYQLLLRNSGNNCSNKRTPIEGLATEELQK